MRQLRIHWLAFKTTLQTRMEYRSDFVLGLVGSLGWQGAGLALLWIVLHAGGGSLGGWSPYQLGLIFGLTSMIQGCSELFFNHIWWTPIYVVRGQFDRLLCYPVRPLPFFLLTCPELHAFGNLGGGLVLYSLCAHGLGLGAEAYLPLPWWVACGSLIHSSFLVLAGSTVLLIKGPSHQFLWLTNSLLSSSRFPLNVYPAWTQGILLFAVPFGTANFVPASALTGRLPWSLALLGPGVAAAACVALAWWAWDRAFRGYESTGS